MRSDALVIPLTKGRHKKMEPLPEFEETEGAVDIRAEDYNNWNEVADACRQFRIWNLSGDFRGYGPLMVTPWKTEHGPAIGDLAGKPGERRVIQFKSDVPPWQRKEQCFVNGMDLWFCPHLAIKGLTFESTVTVRQSSGDFRMEDCLWSGASGYCLRVFTSNVKVHQPFCRDQASVGSDAPAIQVWQVDKNYPVNNVYILNGEIRNWNDGFALGFNKDDPFMPVHNILFDGFDIYLTPDKHLNENGGVYSDAENAVDIKAGSDDPDQPVVISNNRFSGYRYVAPSVAQQGKGANGAAITNHFASRNVFFKNNIVTDCPIGIIEHDYTRDMQEAGGVAQTDSRGTRLAGNIWHGIKSFSPDDVNTSVYITSVGLEIKKDVVIGCQRLGLKDTPEWSASENSVDDLLIDGTDKGEWDEVFRRGDHNEESDLDVLYERNRLSGPYWVRLKKSGELVEEQP